MDLGVLIVAIASAGVIITLFISTVVIMKNTDKRNKARHDRTVTREESQIKK